MLLQVVFPNSETNKSNGLRTSPMDFFPQLEYLFLKDLPVLKRFCVGRNIIFRSLKVMVIEKCPKLESFIFKPVSSSMTLSKELKEMNSKEISHTAMQPLFNEEVTLFLLSPRFTLYISYFLLCKLL